MTASCNVSAAIQQLEAQLQTIEAMIRAEASIVDILTELNSAIERSRNVGLLILQHHVSNCLTDNSAPVASISEDRTRDLVEAIRRFILAVK